MGDRLEGAGVGEAVGSLVGNIAGVISGIAVLDPWADSSDPLPDPGVVVSLSFIRDVLGTLGCTTMLVVVSMVVVSAVAVVMVVTAAAHAPHSPHTASARRLVVLSRSLSQNTWFSFAPIAYELQPPNPPASKSTPVIFMHGGNGPADIVIMRAVAVGLLLLIDGVGSAGRVGVSESSVTGARVTGRPVGFRSIAVTAVVGSFWFDAGSVSGAGVTPADKAVVAAGFVGPIDGEKFGLVAEPGAAEVAARVGVNIGKVASPMFVAF